MRLLLLPLALLGCSPALPVSRFAGTPPNLDPIAFFTGRVRSWGVLEDRFGQPTAVVETDCRGEVDASGMLRMTQRLQTGGGAPTLREWHMRRTGPGTVEASANDMVGTASGAHAGRAFHWHWTLALSPGNPVKNVTMDQWWYLLDDGTLLNRTTIRKLGVVAAEVTEHFARVP